MGFNVGNLMLCLYPTTDCEKRRKARKAQKPRNKKLIKHKFQSKSIAQFFLCKFVNIYEDLRRI